MTEDEAREIVADWLSRDHHEVVSAVDAWIEQEYARIKALDDAARAAEHTPYAPEDVPA